MLHARLRAFLARVPLPQSLLTAAHSVKTPAHAQGSFLRIVKETTDPAHKPGALVAAALHLARFNLLLPLRDITDTFLNASFDNPELYFNLFVQSLSNVPYRSIENANNLLPVLRAMESRQLRLFPDTYDALLKDRYLTLVMTKYLQERMAREGYVPTQDQLEAYLRIFGKKGAIHNAEEYYKAIHAIQSATTHSRHHPDDYDEDDPRFRANTILLSVLNDKSSAFHFLTRLKKDTDEAEAEARFHDYDQRSSSSSTSLPQPRPLRFITKPTPSAMTTTYTQTSLLNVLAKDRSHPTKSLIASFLRIPNPTTATYTVLLRGLLFRNEWDKAKVFWDKYRKTGLEMDRFMLSEGLKVLVRVGMPGVAFGLLEEYAKRPGEGYGSDKGKGKEREREAHPPTFTRTGLRIYRARPNNHTTRLKNPPVSSLSNPQPEQPHSIQLTPILFNAFLVSLKRIGRPDLVLVLFKHMQTLYNLQPNEQTASIVLQSARVAMRMEDTLGGYLGRLKEQVVGRLGVFRRRSTKEGQDFDGREWERERKVAVEEIMELVGSTSPRNTKGREYRGGSVAVTPWPSSSPSPSPSSYFLPTPTPYQTSPLSPLDFARNLFLRIVWGNLPTTPTTRSEELASLVPPADRTRESYDSDEIYLRPRQYTFEGLVGDCGGLRRVESPPLSPSFSSTPSLPQTPSSHPWYPTIPLTNSLFFDYLALLATTGEYAGEIPLVLMWMRYFGIRPSERVVCLAVVCWGEVGLQAPLVERWRSRKGRGGGGEGVPASSGTPSASVGGALQGEDECVKFVSWLVGWLGEEGMPGEVQLRKWRGIVGKMRGEPEGSWNWQERESERERERDCSEKARKRKGKARAEVGKGKTKSRDAFDPLDGVD